MTPTPTRLHFVRYYLLTTAGITFGIGLVLLFWPEAILQWFIPGATGDFFIRFIGSALLGYATLNILAAEAKQCEIQKIAIITNTVTLVIALGLSIYGVAAHFITNLGWLLIGEHLLFVTGFGICIWMEFKTPR